MKCNKSEGCMSSCFHKENHDKILECDDICPANDIAECKEVNILSSSA